MNKKILAALAVIVTLLSGSSDLLAWGIWGHNHINRGAVLALPKEMGLFFYNHIDFITEESTVPDLRKYTMNDKAEFPRHYINLENYHYESRAGMPKNVSEAISKFGKDSTDKWGTLPWHIQEMMTKLTKAFRNKNKTEILFLAADLGHYVGDAHMPLHTTENHDGQLTGQKGIHAFWETQLPELFGKNYNLFTGEAHYIKNVEKSTWDAIDSSYELSFTMLSIEKKLKNDNPEDKQYAMGEDGKPMKNEWGSLVHSYYYAHVYHELLNGMVERQMKKAITMTADLWYTAWVNAGRPDLSDLDPERTTERNKPSYAEDMNAWKKGKVRGCSSTKEFPKVK
jgi:S1/P1 Nuclease